MLDLETMGLKDNAAIIAIGAVKFDLDDKDTREGIISDKTRTFYKVVALQDSVQHGGEMDAETVVWWMNQSDEARNALFGKNVIRQNFVDVLIDFQSFCDDAPHEMWGNGCDFDNVVLQNAYKNIKQTPPWKFRRNQTYRTIMLLGLKISGKTKPDTPNTGTHHNALDDAIYQTLVAQEMYGYLTAGKSIASEQMHSQIQIFQDPIELLRQNLPDELKSYAKGYLSFKEALASIDTHGMEACFKNGTFEHPTK